jgi:hypothetical protein
MILDWAGRLLLPVSRTAWLGNIKNVVLVFAGKLGCRYVDFIDHAQTARHAAAN